MDGIMTVLEMPHTFFEVKKEVFSAAFMKFRETEFCVIPEALNAVDMIAPASELILMMMYTMAFEALHKTPS